MLGRSAASKIIYVRLVGSPETRDPLDPHPNRPAEFFVSKNYLWHIFGSEEWLVGKIERGVFQKTDVSSNPTSQ